jgi:hypothetical protein
MKPDVQSPSNPFPRFIPVAVLPSPPVSPVRNAVEASDIRDIILSLEKRIPVPNVECFAGLLELIHEDTPYMADLMKRVLTTGSENAKRTASLHIMTNVKMFRDGMMQFISGDSMADELRLHWNDANVRDESGRGESDSSKRAKDAIKEDFKKPYPDTDAYWRGLAAARIVYEETDGAVNMSPSIEFILKRAGDHPDIASVINIAVDRRTLDMDVIEHVINDSKEALPLRGGVL